jgi:flagellar hook-basal body complex protein FliE
MTGIEVAVGFLFAWALQKAKRVAARADGQVDQALDAAMDRLHGMVGERLGEGSALRELTAEAEEAADAEGSAELSDPVRQRMREALEGATEQDPDFASALEQAVQQVQDARDCAASTARAQGAGAVAAHGPVTLHAASGSVAAVTMGSVSLTNNPPQPGPQKS